MDLNTSTLDYNNIDNAGTVLTLESFFDYFGEIPYCPAGGTIKVEPNAENNYSITCNEH